MIYVNPTDKAIANGIDVSHWQGFCQPYGDRFTPAYLEPWVEFYGIKACDAVSGYMVDGIDPYFRNNRDMAARCNVRWRSIYIYLRGSVPVEQQFALLVNTVGELQPGECVELDWEDQSFTFSMMEKMVLLLDTVYPGRSMDYLNDNTVPEKDWIQKGRPLRLPHWRATEAQIPISQNAVVWQSSDKGVVGHFPGKNVDLNLVLNRERLDEICGYHS